MGRRGVPKSARSVDVAGYLHLAKDVPELWDQRAVFGRSAPLEIEVGCGKGLFLINAASALASRNFLGIEIAGSYAALTASRLARAAIKNARIVHGDAQLLFTEFFPDASADAIHVYFPDPWWKKRHRRRRLMNETFVKNVQRVLVPGGRLHFWTDVKEYFDTTIQLIRRATSLEGPAEVQPYIALHDMDYHTHYERRVRMHGLPVYRSEFTKQAWRVECNVDIRAASTSSQSPSSQAPSFQCPSPVEEHASMADKRQESIDLLNNTHQFPQPVTIKVIGKNTEAFLERVTAAVQESLGLAEAAVATTRETAGGRHVSVTVEPVFDSADQVLDLYEVLKQIPDVVMLL